VPLIVQVLFNDIRTTPRPVVMGSCVRRNDAECCARDHQIHFRILAAWIARVLLLVSPNKGRGECRAPNAPAASRVKCK
jgi:hypothetical protein